MKPGMTYERKENRESAKKRLWEELDIVRAGKIAVGAGLAMAAAEATGLAYASSAGIIALLSVMSTRKETFAAAGKRCGAFLTAMALSAILFPLLGYEVWTFGLFLLLFYLVSGILRVRDGFSMSAVLATHLLGAETVQAAAIGNEAGLFVIGAGMGILVNLYMPDRSGVIRRLQRKTEEEFRLLLRELSAALRGEEHPELSMTAKQMEEELEQLYQAALYRAGNTFSKDARYLVRYAQMRIRQAEVLNTMADHLQRLTRVTPQGVHMAELFAYTATTFSETNNAKELLEELYALRHQYQESPLPAEREEFENRAVLFHILQMMEYFLKLKKTFAEQMTEEEKNRFWKQDV